MSMYLLERKGKFLQPNYYWGIYPHAWDEWQFQAVLDLAMNFRDRPKMIGEMIGDMIVWTDVERMTA